VLALVVAVLCTPACNGDPLVETTRHEVGDAGGFDAAGVETCGTPGAGSKGEVPREHRAVAEACNPANPQPPAPDGGVPTCTTDADCATDGGFSLFSTCLHGVCSLDQCLTDADCPNGVCGCGSDYGGNIAYHANVCVPGNCHVDADCGPGGYCSPSRGYCGFFMGFYCHRPADTCVDPAVDCASCGNVNACVYQPAVGIFVCGQSICAG